MKAKYSRWNEEQPVEGFAKCNALMIEAPRRWQLAEGLNVAAEELKAAHDLNIKVRDDGHGNATEPLKAPITPPIEAHTPG